MIFSMEKINENLARKIQELQIIEQTLQNLMIQKQTFQLELNEALSALEELSEAKDEVYKIVGQIMVKAKKDSLEKELKSKKDLLELRVKNMEKQEHSLREKLEKLREEVMKEIK